MKCPTCGYTLDETEAGLLGELMDDRIEAEFRLLRGALEEIGKLYGHSSRVTEILDGLRRGYEDISGKNREASDSLGGHTGRRS
jgi:hypothetical protein